MQFFLDVPKKIVSFVLCAVTFTQTLSAMNQPLVVDDDYSSYTREATIAGSRFYCSFEGGCTSPKYFQVTEIHDYNPLVKNTLFAVKVNASTLDSTFCDLLRSNLGFKGDDDLYFLVQRPGSLLRPHHVLHPVDVANKAVDTRWYTEFNAQVGVLPVYPPSVSIDTSNPSISIHAGGSPEPMLSPNNLQISVEGQSLPDYVGKNGSVLFFTKVTGNGRTACSLHYVVDYEDERCVLNALRQKPRTVGEFIASCQSFPIDPVRAYFIDALSCKNPGTTVVYQTPFSAGFDFRSYLETFMSDDKVEAFEKLSSRDKRELRKNLPAVSLLKPDESLEESFSFLDKLARFSKKHGITSLDSSSLSDGISADLLTKMQERLTKLTTVSPAAAISDIDRLKQLSDFEKYRKDLRLSPAFQQKFEDICAQAKTFTESFVGRIVKDRKTIVENIQKKLDAYKNDQKTTDKSERKRAGDFLGYGEKFLENIVQCIAYRDFLVSLGNSAYSEEEIAKNDSLIQALKWIGNPLFPFKVFSTDPSALFDK